MNCKTPSFSLSFSARSSSSSEPAWLLLPTITAGWRKFLASPALIYVAGLLAFVPGLAIVLTHNVWVFGWPLIITLLGWLGLVGGTFRLLFPAQVRTIGSAMLSRAGWLRGGGFAVLALGAILSFFGYLS